MPYTERPLIHLRISFLGAVENIEIITDSITKYLGLHNVKWHTTSDDSLINLDASIEGMFGGNSGDESAVIRSFTGELAGYFNLRAYLTEPQHANSIGFQNIPINQLPNTGSNWGSSIKPEVIMKSVTDGDGLERELIAVVIDQNTARNCHLDI